MNQKKISRWQKLLFFSITALGISSIITQLIILRELLSVFYGNELVLGIIFANWLLLTGIGSWLGKYTDRIKDKVRFLIICQVFVALLPVAHLFIIRSLRGIIFPIGTLIGITQIFLTSLILLLPYCLISGCLLTLFCIIYAKKQDPASIGRVYFIDNIGDILGGFLFSFVLIYLLNPFQMSFFILLLNLVAAILLSNFVNKKLLKVLSIVLLILSPLIIIINFNSKTIALEYRGQDIVFNKNSLYGNLVVTRTEDQLNFFENGLILFSTQNQIENEETVHYAMSQHDNPENILLISGGVAGTTKEILKYNPKRIDYVELDPLIIEIGKRYTNNLNDERINIINIDARLFVKQAKQRYDVVIIDLPDPSTAQLNRFYTDEFLKELKKILKPEAVVSLSLSSQENYMAKEARKLNSTLFRTLENNFKNIIIVPGEVNFFIASDSSLTYRIAERIEGKNIATEYVNKYYLPGKITEDRIKTVYDALKEKVSINRDFTPITYYYYLLFWISHFKYNYSILFSIMIIIMVLYLLKIKPIPFAIFTTGFTASSLELILLIGFQILFGYVYHKIGVIVTMFMLGLAIGAFIMNKKLKMANINHLIMIESLIVLLAILLPVILFFLGKIKSPLLISISTQIIIPVLTLMLAIIVGAEFPLASKLHFKSISHTAATLYNADLIGACIGALIVSALLIPLIGIVKVCIFIAAVNIISLFIVFNKRALLT